MTPREAWLLRVWYDRPRRRELRARLYALRAARLDSTPQRVESSTARLASPRLASTPRLDSTRRLAPPRLASTPRLDSTPRLASTRRLDAAARRRRCSSSLARSVTLPSAPSRRVVPGERAAVLRLEGGARSRSRYSQLERKDGARRAE